MALLVTFCVAKIHYTRFGEVANLLRTCCGLVSDRANKSATSPQQLSWQQVVVMEFGKRHDTTDTTDFCPCPRQLVTDLLRGNWCNGFWPWLPINQTSIARCPRMESEIRIIFCHHQRLAITLYWITAWNAVDKTKTLTSGFNSLLAHVAGAGLVWSGLV